MGKTFVGVKMIGNSEQNLSVYSTQQGNRRNSFAEI